MSDNKISEKIFPCVLQLNDRCAAWNTKEIREYLWNLRNIKMEIENMKKKTVGNEDYDNWD